MVGVFGGHSIFWVKILYSGHQLIVNQYEIFGTTILSKKKIQCLRNAACKDTV